MATLFSGDANVTDVRSDLTTLPSESKFSSSKWFEHLRTFNEALRIKDESRDKSTPPSRVAIIDTGVCPTLQGTDFVKAYRDFVDDKHSSCQDSKRETTTTAQMRAASSSSSTPRPKSTSPASGTKAANTPTTPRFAWPGPSITHLQPGASTSS